MFKNFDFNNFKRLGAGKYRISSVRSKLIIWTLIRVPKIERALVMGIEASTNAKVHLALLKVAAKWWSQKRTPGDSEFVMGANYFEWFVFLVD